MPPRKKAAPKTCPAGHPGCDKCNMHCCAITPERAAEIRASVLSGTHKEDTSHSGPACQCGLRAAKGVCHRHPWKGTP